MSFRRLMVGIMDSGAPGGGGLPPEGLVSITNTANDNISGAATSYNLPNQSLGVAAADRKIIIGIFCNFVAAGVTITSVTVAGITATLVESADDGAFGSTNIAAIYIADVPTGASGDVFITFSSFILNVGISLFRMVGAPSSTANDTGATTAANPLISSLSVPANGVAVAIAGGVNTSGATWSGLTIENVDAVIGPNDVYTSAHDAFVTQQVGLSVSCDFAGSPTHSALATASWGP